MICWVPSPKELAGIPGEYGKLSLDLIGADYSVYFL
jgi:hypothetical protein